MPESNTPQWLNRVASFSWRYLLMLAAIYVTFVAVATVEVVVIPILLALFPTSVLSPIVLALKRRGWSPLMATWGAFLIVIPVLALVVGLTVPSIADGVGPLSRDLTEATDELVAWLGDGPLQLSDTEIEQYVASGIESLRANVGTITTGVLGGATVAIHLITGAILMLLATFYFLKDGDRAYQGLLTRVSDPDRARRGFEAAWRTLSGYVRGLATVGAVDAAFIGIGLGIVGTPLVLPLMILVFVGGFFPVVGAFISGLVAVAVSFVNGGVTDGLIILAIVLGVQQFEGHVLYPIVFKRALSLHPLVILLSIGVGGVAFGLVGAFLAVPIAAVAVAVHQALEADPDASVVSLLTDRPYDSHIIEPDVEPATDTDESA